MSFTDLFRQAQERDEYWTEDAIISFTEQLHSLMKEQGLSQSDLAARIGVSQPYVARILRGRDNFTIATMIKLVRAMGGHLQIVVAKAGAAAAPEKEVRETVTPGSSAALTESEAVVAKQPRRAVRKPAPRSSPDSLRRLP